MPFASCTDIFFTESMRSVFASGTAASAARFMVTISSSAYLPAPTRRISFSVRSSDSGSGIFTFGLARKPSWRPSAATAAWLPFSSAALNAATASRFVMPSNWAIAGAATSTTAHAEPARIARMKRALLGVLFTLALAGCGKPQAPEVRFASVSGESFSTSQLRGKVVLVNFWATWCVTCVREMPKMVETYRKFAPRGYEVVAVAVQSDPPGAVTEFARRRELPFRVALDTNGELAKSFGQVRITPSSFLIDREGRIVKHFVGEPDWAEFHALIERTL